MKDQEEVLEVLRGLSKILALRGRGMSLGISIELATFFDANSDKK